MELNQAIGIAKQLKNQWKAYEFLDEFIKQAVALEGLMGEHERRRDAIQKEVTVLEAKKKKLAVIEPHYAKLEQEVDALEKRKMGMSTIEGDCTRLETEREELQKTVDELKAEVQEITTRMNRSLKKIK